LLGSTRDRGECTQHQSGETGNRRGIEGDDHQGNHAWNSMGVTSGGPHDPVATEVAPLMVTARNPHSSGIGGTIADIGGKFWGAPNTALGLGLAGAGYLAGKIAGTNPRFQLGNNALQLTGIPIGRGR
jgi:hypothetical protein